jgi:hypothetical protein
VFPIPADALVCADRRCATLLPAGVEACDECAGSRFESLASAQSLLCGLAAERPVVFRLAATRPIIIGRSAEGSTPPDIDLSRFPGSAKVHRRHARLEARDGAWQVSHLGSNPVSIVSRTGTVLLQPGGSMPLRPGDTLDLSGVRLQLVARALGRTG